jgi:hypothetical protein
MEPWLLYLGHKTGLPYLEFLLKPKSFSLKLRYLHGNLPATNDRPGDFEADQTDNS